MIRTILLFSIAVGLCPASVFYSNTANDQQTSVFYSASGFTEIGDQLQMVSGGALTSVDAQFFNDGSDATFDAVLRFYNVGAPVGSEIGGSYTVTDIGIAGNASQTVAFTDLNGLVVPQDVVVTLSVENVSANGDIGVNLFDPPTVGASDDTFFIANDGTGFSQDSTFLDIDNPYFQINGNATATPEPALAGLVLVGLLGFLMVGKKSHLKSGPSGGYSTKN